MARYYEMPEREKKGPRGAQLRAMMTAALMPKELAAAYAVECRRLAARESIPSRRDELERMAANLDRFLGAFVSFHEAVQALWLSHMLVMSDENYPGPGVSFGRLDQYLLPYWEHSIRNGWTASSARRSSSASGCTRTPRTTP